MNPDLESSEVLSSMLERKTVMTAKTVENNSVQVETSSESVGGRVKQLREIEERGKIGDEEADVRYLASAKEAKMRVDESTTLILLILLAVNTSCIIIVLINHPLSLQNEFK